MIARYGSIAHTYPVDHCVVTPVGLTREGEVRLVVLYVDALVKVMM